MQNVINDNLKVPPHNLEAERALLGSVLLNSDVIPTVLENLKPGDFYKRAHGEIFTSVINLFQKQEPVDVLTLKNELLGRGVLESTGGDLYLSEVVNSTVASSNASSYARIIKEKSLLRKVIHAAEDIVVKGYSKSEEAEDFIDWAEGQLFKIAEEKGTTSYHRMKDLVNIILKDIEGLADDRKLLKGVPSGFIDLDSKTLGFHPSDLIIIAARPGMGKTALCLNIAQHVALKEKKAVAVFSLEMSKEQLAMRILCSLARVDFYRLRSGILQSEEYSAIARAAGMLSEAPLYIDDSPVISSLELRAKARRLKHELKDDLALIAVDYLQLMRGRERKEVREQEISEISRSLKALAKELNIPVIAISQLNRAVESRQDKRPQLADLRESGAIEQDADLILFIYREELYRKEDTPDEKKGIAEVIIGKHRNGPIGMVDLRFFSEYTRFDNLSKDYS